MDERYTFLMQEIVKTLEEGEVPFSPAFMMLYEVTEEEARKLSSQMAVILLGYMRSPDWARGAWMAAGIADEKSTPYGVSVEKWAEVLLAQAAMHALTAYYENMLTDV